MSTYEEARKAKRKLWDLLQESAAGSLVISMGLGMHANNSASAEIVVGVKRGADTSAFPFSFDGVPVVYEPRGTVRAL